MRALKTVGYLLGCVVSVIYVLNPGAGVFELLPDALPIVGNLDEAAMVTLFLTCVRGLRRLGEEKKKLAAPRGSSRQRTAPTAS